MQGASLQADSGTSPETYAFYVICRITCPMEETHLRVRGVRHLPYEITQCYLPSDTSECVPP